MTVVTPTGRAFTIDDLEAFPSDGNRYELIEGSLHVSPSPVKLHQRAVANLFHVLRSSCPPEYEVFASPLDVVFGPATLLVPDLIVLPADEPSVRRIESTPLLAVEVLSPSTRLFDLGTKRLVYREAGLPAYWVVDTSAPSLTEWRWHEGNEAERVIAGDETGDLAWPFSVTVTPSSLLVPNG